MILKRTINLGPQSYRSAGSRDQITNFCSELLLARGCSVAVPVAGLGSSLSTSGERAIYAKERRPEHGVSSMVWPDRAPAGAPVRAALPSHRRIVRGVD